MAMQQHVGQFTMESVMILKMYDKPSVLYFSDAFPMNYVTNEAESFIRKGNIG